MKIKEKNLAWNDEKFRAWWGKYGDMNPGIDPKKLSKISRRVLNYINENGERDVIGIRKLYRDLHKKNNKKDFLAWNCSEFRNWFERYEDLNPDIDPTKLGKHSKKSLNYIREDGAVSSIITNTLIRRLESQKRTGVIRPIHEKCITRKFAWENEQFRKVFTKELNPGIDLTKILMYDRKIPLHYYGDSGKIRTIYALSWFRAERKGRTIDKKYFCWSYPEFQCFFNPTLNPELDPHTIKTYDIRGIRYITAAGTIGERKIKNLFYLKNGEPVFHLPSDYQTIDLAGKIQMDEKFWDYYSGPKSESSGTIAKAYGNGGRLYFRCPKGHDFKMTLNTFYKYHDEPCPYCSGRQVDPETNSAAAIDPELELFLADDRYDLHYMSPNRAQPQIKFKCPLCGHEFKRELKNIVGKHPKCPVCKDIGIMETSSNSCMKTDVLYLSRE